MLLLLAQAVAEPSTGLLDGYGSELGASAILMFMIREAFSQYKEYKLRKRLNGGKQKKHNPGNSSSDLILHLVQEHASLLADLNPKQCETHQKDIRIIEKDIKEINTKLGELGVKLARVEEAVN